MATSLLVVAAAAAMLAVAFSHTTSSTGNDILFEMLPLIRVYKNGRVERLCGTDTLPPGMDPSTGVFSKDVVIDSTLEISARLYLPVGAGASPSARLPVLVYFHGGAFLIESPFSHTYHPHLNSLASLAPLLGVSVNYRLAPEHPLPAAYKDSWAALLWVLSRSDPWLAELGDFDRLYLAGDSAGANIAHQLAMRAGEEGVTSIRGMALVHPYFWGSVPVGSEWREPGFRSGMERLWRFLCPGTAGLEDPRINPMAEGETSLAVLGCQRLLVAVAGEDMLWSRGRLYYESLRSSGWPGEAELVDFPGVEHDFHIFHPETDQAAAMTRRLAEFFGQRQDNRTCI